MVSIGELIGRLILEDELTPAMKEATDGLKDAGTEFEQFASTADEALDVLREAQGVTSDFAAAALSAETALDVLREAQDGAATATDEAASAAESYAQELLNTAAALEDVGGVTSLTADAQAEMAKEVEEALSQYEALGKDAPQALRDLKQSLDEAKESQEDLNDSTAGGVAAALGLAGGYATVKGFVMESVAAYSEEEDALARLTAALTSRGRASAEVIDTLKAQASAFQSLTTTGDETILSMQALFTTLGDVGVQDMEQAVEAALNLSAALGRDVESSARLVSRAITGNVQMFKRLGVELDEGRAKAEGAAYVLGELNKQFGGAAVAGAKTYSGQMAQLANQFSDMQEKLGAQVVPALLALNSAAKAGIPVVEENAGALVSLAGAAGTVGGALLGLRAWQTVAGWFGGAAGAAKLLTTGLIGPGSLVVATGLAAAGIGTLISRLIDAGEESDSFTARAAAGFGKVIVPIKGLTDAAEDAWVAFKAWESGGFTATEIAEKLGQASEVAGRQVTNFNEALEILAGTAQMFAKIQRPDIFTSGIAVPSADDAMTAMLGQRESLVEVNARVRSAEEELNRVIEEGGAGLAKKIEKMDLLGLKAEDLAGEYSTTEAVIAAYKKQIEEAAQKTEEQASKMKDANEAIRDAGKAFEPLTAAQQKQAQAWDDMGVGAEHIATKLGVSAGAVTAFLDVSKQMEAWEREWIGSLPERWEAASQAVGKATEAMGQAIVKNFLAMRDAQEVLADLQEDEGAHTAVAQQTLAIQRKLEQDIKALDTSAGNFKDAKAALEAVANKQIADLIAQDELDQLVLFSNLETEAAKRAKELNDAASAAALDGLAQFFTSLGAINGGLGTFMASIGSVVVGFKAARDQAKMTGKDGTELGGRFGSLSTIFNDNATKAQKLTATFASATQIAGGLADIWQKTGDAATRSGAAMSGAMAGAQAGAMFGPWGAAIGAGVGAIAGLLRKPAWREASKEAARDFGVEISQELAKGIADQAKKEFGGSRQAASIFNLSKIIEEGGGLNAGNLGMMTGKLRDVFVMLETGTFDAAQAAQVLDENWDQFAKASTDRFGALSKGMREILQLSHRMGVVTEQQRQFMQEQVGVAQSGINAVISVSTESFREMGSAVEEAQKKVDELKKVEERGRGADWTRDMAAAQKELTDALSKTFGSAEAAKGELEDLGAIAVGTFASALASGKSYNEALAEAGPGLRDLAASYEALGLNVEDAGLRTLMLQAQIRENNPALLAGVEGLSSSFTALGNIGALTVDQFRAMERQGARMFERMQAEAAEVGGETKDALLPMQGYLHNAAREAAALGIALDPLTQQMIDQSKELGIWKDEGEDAGDTLQDTFKDVASAVRELVDELRGVPRNIETEWNFRRTGDDFELPDPNAQPDLTPMALGGVVTRATPVLAGERGPEAIVPLSRMDFMGGSEELAALRMDFQTYMAQQPRMIAVAVRDAKNGAI